MAFSPRGIFILSKPCSCNIAIPCDWQDANHAGSDGLREVDPPLRIAVVVGGKVFAAEHVLPCGTVVADLHLEPSDPLLTGRSNSSVHCLFTARNILIK